jgi:hypothetical protein
LIKQDGQGGGSDEKAPGIGEKSSSQVEIIKGVTRTVQPLAL